MVVLEHVSMTVQIPIVFRIARHDDLPKLEWYGQYTHYRYLFRRAFREQQQGRRVMLIADSNDFPIGHIFVLFKPAELLTPDSDKHAYLSSLRVMDMFRGQGIGTRLIQEAEAAVLDHGFHRMTIAVTKENHGALRLYERLGYQIFTEDAGRWSYFDHRGKLRMVNEPCWILEKFI